MNTIPIRPLLALKLVTLAAFTLLMLLMNSCHYVGVQGNGKIATESRVISDFNRLQADGAMEVTWVAGPPAFSITTDSNLMEFVHAKVSGDQLLIEWEKPLRATRGIKVTISSPHLNRATLNGAVRLSASQLTGSEFYLEANGATRVVLSGTLNAVQAEMNGASRLDAEALVTRAMDLSIAGAGRADVNVTEALKVDISGAGKVIYTGNPTIRKEISGAGSVRHHE